MKEKWIHLSEEIPMTNRPLKIKIGGKEYYGIIVSEIDDINNDEDADKEQLLQNVADGISPAWRFYQYDEYFDDDPVDNWLVNNDTEWMYVEPEPYDEDWDD